VIVDIGATVTRRLGGPQRPDRIYPRAADRRQNPAHPGTSPGSSTCRWKRAEAAKARSAKPCRRNFGPDVLQPFKREDRAGDPGGARCSSSSTSTQFNKVDHILLTGGSAMLDGLEEMVAQADPGPHRGREPVREHGRWVRPKIKPRQLTIDAPSLMVACGLAMRRFDPS